MRTGDITFGSRMRALFASTVVGVLAGATVLLLANANGGTATTTDVLNWALGGLVVGASVGLVCTEVARLRGELSMVLPAALVTGPVFTVGVALWAHRADPWSGEPLYFYGAEALMGLILGSMVAVATRLVLARSVRVDR
ncbi:MAG: hypothetical protein ABIR57_07295 [Aeromicrobium sp.]